MRITFLKKGKICYSEEVKRRNWILDWAKKCE